MLHDVLRHGVFANHPGRYRVRIVDAMEPEKDLPRDVCFLNHPRPEKPFRAVFLNYLLDCLPAAVLELDGEEVRQLHVRTCLGRGVKLEDFTDMSVEHLKDRAVSQDPFDKQELLEVYGSFASEYDYRPVDVKKLPYGEFGYDYARRLTKRCLLSWGAIQSLEKLLGLIADDGFILVNDYGQTQVTREDEFEHQRFSLATFVGVNFPLLKAYFGDGGRCEWVEPNTQEESIHTRLLSRRPARATIVRLLECFSKDAQDQNHKFIQQAREAQRVGRFELAGDCYRQALKRQPGNWVLLNEMSMFMTFAMREAKRGIDMARLALELNPTCSAELWNTLGDGLFEFGRTAEARSAYQKALQVNETDVRARYNLAWVHAREKNYKSALTMLAEALALDKTGEYHERLLQKQQEVLGQATLRNRQEYLLLINLVSRYAKPEDKDKPRRDAVTAVFAEESQRGTGGDGPQPGQMPRRE
jgi:tetratricopeptide (TPR) repeat protein